MKKYMVISLSLLFLLVFSCKKEKTNVLNKPSINFTITSDISNVNDSIYVFSHKVKLNSKDRIDSIISKNGVFKITLPSDTTPQKYRIKLLKYPTKEYINSTRCAL